MVSRDRILGLLIGQSFGSSERWFVPLQNRSSANIHIKSSPICTVYTSYRIQTVEYNRPVSGCTEHMVSHTSHHMCLCYILPTSPLTTHTLASISLSTPEITCLCQQEQRVEIFALLYQRHTLGITNSFQGWGHSLSVY